MSHMQRDVFEGDYFEIETSAGTEIIPYQAVFGLEGKTAFPKDLAMYCEGDLISKDQIDPIAPQHGFLARMSAPGYLDRTEWTAWNTRQDAEAYLDEFYGDQ